MEIDQNIEMRHSQKKVDMYSLKYEYDNKLLVYQI